MSDKRELIVPSLGESVSEAIIAHWVKSEGSYVEQDDLLLELETDKVTLEINAPISGLLTDIRMHKGDTVQVGDVLAFISNDAEAIAAARAHEVPTEAVTPAAAPEPEKVMELVEEVKASPAAKKWIETHQVQVSAIQPTGKDGRITKQDVLRYLGQSTEAPQISAAKELSDTRIRREPMSKLRQTIAKRLKEAQNTAAMLTTFNEVDMTNVVALRARLQDDFVKKHGVKLGLMSFFVKAAVQALQEIPALNAEVDGSDILYKNFYNIGVAVGAPKGLMVPVIRDADQLSFAEIEQEIFAKAVRAREGNLSMEEMLGGSFTITNGGVYGSMMSTPILNGTQSGILGMHNIVKRAVVVDDQIQIRPMMYIALSYDHRIVDGKEAVSFLVRIKQCIENPERLMLNI